MEESEDKFEDAALFISNDTLATVFCNALIAYRTRDEEAVQFAKRAVIVFSEVCTRCSHSE